MKKNLMCSMCLILFFSLCIDSTFFKNTQNNLDQKRHIEVFNVYPEMLCVECRLILYRMYVENCFLGI